MRKDVFDIKGRPCTVYSGDEPEFFLLQPSDEHEAEFMDHEAELIAEGAGQRPFAVGSPSGVRRRAIRKRSRGYAGIYN